MVTQVIRILLDLGVFLVLVSFFFGKYLDRLREKISKTDSTPVTKAEVYRIVNEILDNRNPNRNLDDSEVSNEEKNNDTIEDKTEQKDNNVAEYKKSNRKDKHSSKNKKGKPTSIRATGNSKSAKKNSGVAISANEVLSKSDRRKRIIELHNQGMDAEQIVKELKASMGEVRLVIDLNRPDKH